MIQGTGRKLYQFRRQDLAFISERTNIGIMFWKRVQLEGSQYSQVLGCMNLGIDWTPEGGMDRDSGNKVGNQRVFITVSKQ